MWITNYISTVLVSARKFNLTAHVIEFVKGKNRITFKEIMCLMTKYLIFLYDLELNNKAVCYVGTSLSIYEFPVRTDHFVQIGLVNIRFYFPNNSVKQPLSLFTPTLITYLIIINKKVLYYFQRPPRVAKNNVYYILNPNIKMFNKMKHMIYHL